MIALLELVKKVEDRLLESAISNARRQAEEMIAHVLGYKRLDLYLQHDRLLNVAEQARCMELAQRRCKSEPLAHLLEYTEFYGCHILVCPDVLIPRNETEHMVDCIATRLASWSGLEGKVLWDVCTGSGCIGIALKKKFPDLKVFLSDISPDACAIAEKNAKLNNVEVEVVQGDLFTPFGEAQADFIVCNPPYIAEEEFSSLEPEVRLFEPKGALVAQEEGLMFYRALHKQLPARLRLGGFACVEMGSTQAEQVKNILTLPPSLKTELGKDLSGHNRFFFLENE